MILGKGVRLLFYMVLLLHLLVVMHTPQGRVLPNLNGTAFPQYRPVFTAGECDRADATSTGRPFPLPNGGGYTDINTDKTCFSCFRIPTLLAGLTPGVVHAFAEARRSEMSGIHRHGPGSCPDGPDTRWVPRTLRCGVVFFGMKGGPFRVQQTTS